MKNKPINVLQHQVRYIHKPKNFFKDWERNFFKPS